MTTSPTPHRFDNPVWELSDVFGWVLDRDPAQFGGIFSEDDWLAASYGAVMYRVAREPQARTVLLHALQCGELTAWDRDGNKVKAAFWFSKTESHLSSFGRVFLFRRKDVLKLWPDDAAAAAAPSGEVDQLRLGAQLNPPLQAPPDNGEATAVPERAATPARRSRLGYLGELQRFLANKKGTYWNRTTDPAIEQQFRKHLGVEASHLPGRRYLIRQIKKIRARAPGLETSNNI